MIVFCANVRWFHQVPTITVIVNQSAFLVWQSVLQRLRLFEHFHRIGLYKVETDCHTSVRAGLQ